MASQEGCRGEGGTYLVITAADGWAGGKGQRTKLGHGYKQSLVSHSTQAVQGRAWRERSKAQQVEGKPAGGSHHRAPHARLPSRSIPALQWTVSQGILCVEWGDSAQVSQRAMLPTGAGFSRMWGNLPVWRKLAERNPERAHSGANAKG